MLNHSMARISAALFGLLNFSSFVFVPGRRVARIAHDKEIFLPPTRRTERERVQSQRKRELAAILLLLLLRYNAACSRCLRAWD